MMDSLQFAAERVRPIQRSVVGTYRRPGSKRRLLAMISRIWHGWTSRKNADAYEKLLREEIFAGIQDRNIPGFKSIQLLRRQVDHEVEFVTIMLFESLDAVKEFAGADYEACVVPEKARALLARFDQRSQHYEFLVEHKS
jgi:hypothetical protein